MKTSNERRLTLRLDIEQADTASDVLARHSGLSKSQIKDAMAKGAARLRRGGRWRRLRRATFGVKTGDRLELYYDSELLARVPPPARCLADERAGGYSVWDKPAGLLAAGTLWGDHYSLLRLTERYFEPRRQAFLVHRLDREARGLMLVAHTGKAAAALSRLFQQGKVYKAYRAWVRGRPYPENAAITLALDGKPARSRYRVLHVDAELQQSELEVIIETGRKHQIRRHLAAIGHPLLGDPRYGSDNKNEQGLRLSATELAFTCPLSGRARRYTLVDDKNNA